MYNNPGMVYCLRAEQEDNTPFLETPFSINIACDSIHIGSISPLIHMGSLLSTLACTS